MTDTTESTEQPFGQPDGQQEQTPRRKPKPGKRVSLSFAVFLSLFLCIAVFLSTYTVMKIQADNAVNEQKAALSKYSKLDSLFRYINENYVRQTDEKTLWDGVYAGLFQAVGDPYTCYMTDEEFAAYQSGHSGSYVGIGITVAYDPDTELIYIHRVSPHSPAEEAGIKAGDRITAADGVQVSRKTYNEAVGKIAGEEGTSVKLTISRNGQTMEKTLTRASVPTQNVLYEKIGTVAYITLLSFSDNTAFDQFSQALEQAKQEGCTAYLFDLRNNPGGNLEVICNCLDLLLPEGIIVNIVDADGAIETRNSDAERFLDAPMAVLCNGNTASAAELFTADLRDYGLATIVGEKTFGKGTMQTITKLADGSAMKLTTRYYNPKSNISYDGVGIVPDREVKLTKEQSERFYLLTHEQDPQLQEALRVLQTAD